MQPKSFFDMIQEHINTQLNFKQFDDVFLQQLRKQENAYVSLNAETPLVKFDGYPKQGNQQSQMAKKLRNGINLPWLNQGKLKIQEIAIKDYMYLYSLQVVKINSVMIVNPLGHIIYANKLASEHFQGSLNSFATNSFEQFVIKSQKEEFMKLINRYMGKKVWVNYLTYSKSSKRKYALHPEVKEVSVEDIYFRYLKMIKSRVSPIKINFKGREKIDGFWNDSLISKEESQFCFLIQSRYGQRLPKIDLEVLLKDEGVIKFLSNTQKKKNVRGEEQITVANPRHFYEKCRKNFHKAFKQRQKMLKEMFKAKKRELDRIRDTALNQKRGISIDQLDNQYDESDQLSCQGLENPLSEGKQENLQNNITKLTQQVNDLHIGALSEHEPFPIDEETPWHSQNYPGLYLHTDDPNLQIKEQQRLNLQRNMQQESISNDLFGSVYHGDLIEYSSNIESQCSLFRDPTETNQRQQMKNQKNQHKNLEIQIGQYLIDFNE